LLNARGGELAAKRVAFETAFVELALKIGDGSLKIGHRIIRHLRPSSRERTARNPGIDDTRRRANEHTGAGCGDRGRGLAMYSP
jgi:hypothetical protein